MTSGLLLTFQNGRKRCPQLKGAVTQGHDRPTDHFHGVTRHTGASDASYAKSGEAGSAQRRLQASDRRGVASKTYLDDWRKRVRNASRQASSSAPILARDSGWLVQPMAVGRWTPTSLHVANPTRLSLWTNNVLYELLGRKYASVRYGHAGSNNAGCSSSSG